MTRKPTCYRVSFTEVNHWYLDIDARTAPQAIAKARALYERVGPKGFRIDMERGGTDDWYAIPNGEPDNG